MPLPFYAFVVPKKKKKTFYLPLGYATRKWFLVFFLQKLLNKRLRKKPFQVYFGFLFARNFPIPYFIYFKSFVSLLCSRLFVSDTVLSLWKILKLLMIFFFFLSEFCCDDFLMNYRIHLSTNSFLDFIEYSSSFGEKGKNFTQSNFFQFELLMNFLKN